MPAAQNIRTMYAGTPHWHFFLVPMLMLTSSLAAYKLVHDWPLKNNHHSSLAGGSSCRSSSLWLS